MREIRGKECRAGAVLGEALQGHPNQVGGETDQRQGRSGGGAEKLAGLSFAMRLCCWRSETDDTEVSN